MDESGHRRATLQDVAEAAGVGVATVSYALRGSAKIPAATTARVREAAARLGYRPNPRVAELMATVRRGGRLPSGDRLALVWPERARGTFERLVAGGARARAAERGYALEEFRLAAFAGRAGRLVEILRARGIEGVVFGPALTRDRVEVDWPWEDFAMAVIGSAEWRAPLSRAAHHHYEAMRLALAALERAGARRPVALLDAVTNERAHRGWQAAWLAYGGADAAGRLKLLAAEEDAAEWVRARGADGVVADKGRTLARLGEATPQVAVVLSRVAGDPWPGVAQGYDVIAGHAVDLVVAQLQRNERGLPDPPRALLFPGRWAEG